MRAPSAVLHAVGALVRRRCPTVSVSARHSVAVTELVRVVRRSCHDFQRHLRVDRIVLDERLTEAGELLDGINRVIVDTDTLLRAGMYGDDPPLGSLDAIHLVCAMEIGPELTSFITYDKALARAAGNHGFPVEQPQ